MPEKYKRSGQIQQKKNGISTKMLNLKSSSWKSWMQTSYANKKHIFQFQMAQHNLIRLSWGRNPVYYKLQAAIVYWCCCCCLSQPFITAFSLLYAASLQCSSLILVRDVSTAGSQRPLEFPFVYAALIIKCISVSLSMSVWK